MTSPVTSALFEMMLDTGGSDSDREEGAAELLGTSPTCASSLRLFGVVHAENTSRVMIIINTDILLAKDVIFMRFLSF